MIARKLSLFIYSLWLILSASSWADTFLNDVSTPSSLSFIQTLKFEDQKMIHDLAKLNLDILGINHQEKTVDIQVSYDEVGNLEEKGLNIISSYPQFLTAPPDSRYKTPTEIENHLKSLNKKYPKLSKVFSLGKTHEGREIWAMRISNSHDYQSKKPSVLINSMHHAREIMTPEIALDLIEYLLGRYESDLTVKKWVENLQIYIVPMVNPDGNHKVWNENNMWRKNALPPYGVDINRNYPYQWSSCAGSSGLSWAQDYRGSSAGSEKETQALMGLVKKIRPIFDISFHSYSELVIYPMGCQGKSPLYNGEQTEKIGHRLGSLTNYKSGTAWELLYPVDGGDIDWMMAEYQVIPYVLEVNSTKQGFQPEYSQWRDKTVKRVRVAWKYLFARILGSGLRGEVAAEGAWTVEAYRDQKLIATYKGQGEENYHLVLDPGTYELKVSDRLGTREVLVEVQEELIRFNL